ncbi:MAG: hypothetical protein Q9M36_11645 [Sulfurovum sp.]|nr:hypothetical protein [Sulfurovum sp.]
MSEELELKLLKENEELKKRLDKLEGKNLDGKPTYSFSKISKNDLYNLVDIQKEIGSDTFLDWFSKRIEISKESEDFFHQLILENKDLIYDYNEEDLKVNVIIPILNRVKFKSFDHKFRDFYELQIRYETEKFIFNGTTDFVVSKGLIRSKKPYFFIQEFKKGQINAYPEPQLLAELIAGVELNKETVIKGAYIVGAIWNFVILEKLGKDKYQYFVSENFDSSKIGDLKGIYRNLVFVKEEIIEMIQNEN